MRLHDWIKSVGVSGAASPNVSRQCVCNWLRGKRKPSDKLKTRTARVTKGSFRPSRVR
jgi:hypothetical protein